MLSVAIWSSNKNEWGSKERYGTELIGKRSLFWPRSIYSCSRDSILLRSGEDSSQQFFLSLSQLECGVQHWSWSPWLWPSPPPLAFTPHPSPHLPWASCGDLGLSRVCERLHAEHRRGRRLLKHLDRALGLIKTECGKKKRSVIFMRFIAFSKWRNLWSISKRKCQVWQVHSVPPKNVKKKMLWSFCACVW